MFRCLALELLLDVGAHSRIRRQICQKIENTSKYYEEFIVDMTFEEYLIDMRKLGTWCDHICIQAACELFNVNIIVEELSFDQTALEISHDLRYMGWESYLLKQDKIRNNLNSLPIIHLVRYRGHYGVIRSNNHNNFNILQTAAIIPFKVSSLKALQWNNNNYNASEPPKKRAKTSNTIQMDKIAVSNEAKTQIEYFAQLDEQIATQIQKNHFKSVENNEFKIDCCDEIEDVDLNADFAPVDAALSNEKEVNLNNSNYVPAPALLGLCLPSLDSNVQFGSKSSIIYADPNSKATTLLNRPPKIARALFKPDNLEPRYQFLLQFQLYMIARFTEVPRLTKSAIIREEFSCLYAKKGETLTTKKVNTLRKMVNNWLKDNECRKLNYLARPDGFRIGGAGTKCKLEYNIIIAVGKECFLSILEGFIPGTENIKHILYAVIKEAGKLEPTFDRSIAKINTDYFYISDHYARLIRKKFKFTSVSRSKTYYNPIQVKEDQIPELLTILIVKEILPIMFVFALFVVLFHSFFRVFINRTFFCALAFCVEKTFFEIDWRFAYFVAYLRRFSTGNT